MTPEELDARLRHLRATVGSRRSGARSAQAPARCPVHHRSAAMFALGQSAQALEILNEPTPSPSSASESPNLMSQII